MLQWQERFCIGVESIDKAHQELFRIINKLHSIMGMENSNRKWTAVEALKYVRNYTLKHFEDEEAYMRSIGFKGYEAHKAIHTNMREKVIPHLEAHLAREDYSVQSIGFFLTVFEKWLTQHIVGHDRDIMQKAVPNVEEQATGEKAEEKNPSLNSLCGLPARQSPGLHLPRPPGDATEYSGCWFRYCWSGPSMAPWS